jgi:iron(II)-dependent oxidoreductase
MDRIDPLPACNPVIHVSYHEAEAYARFIGKRLPTEAEWEKAALWDPSVGRTRIYPWGDERPDRSRANLDQLAFEPTEVGAYPAGASAYGVEQMTGDVWEWTASNFAAYPGFIAFPYPEYSQIFFGDDYKVLRGGSWATRSQVARGSFRNWDLPIRCQIFSGIRCAADSRR